MWRSNPFYPTKSAYQWAGYRNRKDFLTAMAKWGRMTITEVEAIEKSMNGGKQVLPGELEHEISRRRTRCPTCGF